MSHDKIECCWGISDAGWALMLLRLFLGVRFVHAFFNKAVSDAGEFALKNVGDASQHISGMFSGKLPDLLLTPYANTLPYVELLLGITLLLGVRTRKTLVLMGLTYISLAFGMMLLNEWPHVAHIGLHLALVCGALLLARHGRYELWPERNS